MQDRSVYKKTADRKDAPREVHCVSAVAYLFKQTMEESLPFPRAFIGSLPRTLLEHKEWNLTQLSLSELQMGDLIFTKNPKKDRSISHLMMCMEAKQGGSPTIFHATSQRSGVCIEPLSNLSESFLPCPEEVLRNYFDSRDQRSNAFVHQKKQSPKIYLLLSLSVLFCLACSFFGQE